jgi:hypothetical protein
MNNGLVTENVIDTMMGHIMAGELQDGVTLVVAVQVERHSQMSVQWSSTWDSSE